MSRPRGARVRVRAMPRGHYAARVLKLAQSRRPARIVGDKPRKGPDGTIYERIAFDVLRCHANPVTVWVRTEDLLDHAGAPTSTQET